MQRASRLRSALESPENKLTELHREQRDEPSAGSSLARRRRGAKAHPSADEDAEQTAAEAIKESQTAMDLADPKIAGEGQHAAEQLRSYQQDGSKSARYASSGGKCPFSDTSRDLSLRHRSWRGFGFVGSLTLRVQVHNMLVLGIRAIVNIVQVLGSDMQVYDYWILEPVG